MDLEEWFPEESEAWKRQWGYTTATSPGLPLALSAAKIGVRFNADGLCSGNEFK